MNQGLRPDIEEIRRALSCIMLPGQVTELRAIGAVDPAWRKRTDATISGYFDDMEALAQAAVKIEAKGVYVIPNQVEPELLHRAINRARVLGTKDATTADDKIIRRLWLLVDADPVRPDSYISATDAEHEAALERAASMRGWLTEQGWPLPNYGDSGNGGHLMYAVDLPTDDQGLVQRCLQALAGMFDDPAVKVDQSVYNPSRVWKLYGTVACKGDNSPKRPHRLSRLLEVPEEISLVPLELLEALASLAPEPEQSKTVTQQLRRAGAGPQRLDVPKWMADHGIAWRNDKAWQGGTRWLLEVCPFDANHTDNSAYIVQFADGRIGAGCSHNSCKTKGWGWVELRRRFDSEYAARQDAYLANEYGQSNGNGHGNGNGNHQAAAVQEAEPAEHSEENEAVPVPARRPAGDKPAEEPAKKKKTGKSELQILMEIAAQAELFRSPTGEFYARVRVGKGSQRHIETWPLSEKGASFRRWLTWRFMAKRQKPPSSTALADAMRGLEALADREGNVERAFIRLAHKDGAIYLDLGDDTWRVVEITAEKWRIIRESPVIFRRPRGILPLPIPSRKGNITDIQRLLHVSSAEDTMLAVGWLMGCLHPHGPYAHLAIYGERGSAKSSTTRLLRGLLDPNEAAVRSAPKEDRDLAIAAKNSWIVALDNLSHLPAWLSDDLCRLATGHASATRALYTDDEEALFSAKRPCVFNGIEEVATRGDLLDRLITIMLPAIPEEERLSEREAQELFNELAPSILGALLDGAVAALRNLPDTHFDRLPRMADFVLWAEAAGESFGWEPGAFLAAFDSNQERAVEVELESSPLAQTLIAALRKNDDYLKTTPNGLLDELNQVFSGEKPKSWPKTPRSLSGALQRIAPALRAVGISITRPPRTNGTRWIVIERQSGASAGARDSAGPVPVSAANGRDSAGPVPVGFRENGLSVVGKRENSAGSVGMNPILSVANREEEEEGEEIDRTGNEPALPALDSDEYDDRTDDEVRVEEALECVEAGDLAEARTIALQILHPTYRAEVLQAIALKEWEVSNESD